MKLQVNTSGAWKDVLRFQPKDEEEVRRIAARLSFFSGGSSKFRIADDLNNALAHCDAPFFEWRSTWRESV